MNFLTEDFLLQSDEAKKLYHNYAQGLPIIDYHNHLPPNEIAANKKFDTKKEAWNYIKEQRKNHKKYNLDKEIKFVLREEIVKYYNDL